MLYSYLIYQRPLDEKVIKHIQSGTNERMSNAYFDLMHMNGNTSPENTVYTGFLYNLYKPTMFMQYAGSEKSLESTRLEAIFAEGNGIDWNVNGQDNPSPIKTTHLMKHYSLSVGDIVVNILDNIAFVCMPTGWHELEETNLELNIS